MENPTNEEIKRDLFKSEIRSKDEESRTIEFVISTPDKDRHGTVLNQANWDLENFNANPIVGYQHDVYGSGFLETDNPDTIIGKAEVYVEEKRGSSEKQLIGKVTFEGIESTGNELAEKVFKKIQFGSMSATSVGFKPLKDENGKIGQYGRKTRDGNVEDEGTFYYFGQELLEFSVVKIPSNPKAIKRTAEFFESLVEEKTETKKDESKETIEPKVDLDEAKQKELKQMEEEEADRIQRELQMLRYKLMLNKNR